MKIGGDEPLLGLKSLQKCLKYMKLVVFDAKFNNE
jgi:hypothetical protein